MKTRPMLFSDAMVRAILDGRKTQTRRVYKLSKSQSWYAELGGEAAGWFIDDKYPDGWWHVEEMTCPYGKHGDRIWVRECHYVIGETNEVFYRASGGLSQYAERDHLQNNPPLIWQGPWRPSIFMKRAWSRIALEITNVRVERLQDISNADAIAEGVGVHVDHHNKPRESIYSPVQAYRDLWESINGQESWGANPWVWVIEFKRVDNSQ